MVEIKDFAQVRTCGGLKTIKMAERVKLKEMMKGLVSKKRRTTEAELDTEIIGEPIADTTNDVRTCVNTSMLDFGEVVSANSDEEGERDVGKEDFINKTRVKGKQNLIMKSSYGSGVCLIGRRFVQKNSGIKLLL